MVDAILSRNFSCTFEQLCNFAAVSKTGRISDIIRGLILLCFSLNKDRYQSAGQFAETIDLLHGISIPERDISSALNELEKAGKVTLCEGEYVPDPAAQADLMHDADEARRLEQRVKDTWQAEITTRYLSIPLDSFWGALRGYLQRVFRRHGMQSVALLQPQANLPTDYQESLHTLLQDAISSSLDAKFHPLAREAISTFMASVGQDADRAAYMVQLADVAFNFFKLEVSPEASQELVRRLPELTLFLDTNFVFGLLNLHNNPQVEVSMKLVEVIKKHELPFRLRYHERTQKEIRDTASFYGGILRSHYWPKSLSKVAVASRRLSGLETKFHELNSQGHVDVNEFLRRIEHFDVVVEEADIKLYRMSQDRTKEWADLYAEYATFLEKHGKKDKAYEVIQHDVVLLDTVSQLRSKAPSTIEAGTLILTCDFYLYLFDQLQAKKENRLPCVILPNSFWQMLRPYMKSDTDFDKAFAETFALPEFSVIGGGGGRACSKMLGILAAYKDLPEETATRLLTNGVLVDHLSQATDGAEFNALVEAAIVTQNAELMEERAALERQVQQEAETRKALEAAHHEALKKEENLKEDLRRQLEGMQSAVEKLQNEMASQKQSFDATMAAARQASQKATAVQQERDAEADARQAAEAKTSKLERQATLLAGALGVLLAVMLFGGLEAIIHLTNTGFSGWARGHTHTLGLQLSFGLLITFVCMSVCIRRHRKWFVIAGALQVIFVILQII